MLRPKGTKMSDTRKMMEFEAQRKSPLAAYLLWIFAGLLGAHRLYMGKWATGLHQLLLCVPVYIIFWFALGGSNIIAGAGDSNLASQGNAESFGVLAFALIITLWVFIDLFLIGGWVRRHNLRIIEKIEPDSGAATVGDRSDVLLLRDRTEPPISAKW